MKYIFPQNIEGCSVLKHIFPSKQKDVAKIIELAKMETRIKRVIVFGSAITAQCTPQSDVDIAIIAPVPHEVFVSFLKPFYQEVESDLDIIHYDVINNSLLKADIDKGVCVYEA